LSVFRSVVLAIALLAAAGGRAAAQTPAAPAPPTPTPAASPPAPAAPPPAPQPSPTQSILPSTGQSEQLSETFMRVGQNHYIRQGKVEIHDPRNKTDIYADLVEFFEDEDRAVATGNFVMSQGTNRISAERAEFNTKSGLGTFYNASGIPTTPPPRQQTRPGAFPPPPLAGQDTIVYFFGETIEKVGPKKYKITNGGFSTCVQPTPRWEMSASTVTLNVDHYTLLKNAVMTVKGVPMLYLPVLYYPTKKEDRATGILLPTYGMSSYRGQTIHNGFFWAINRSQDATLMHDW
jgi:LPS-assembly protein